MLGKPATREDWLKAKWETPSFYLSKDQIDKVFADAKEQVDYIIGMYRLVYNGYNQFRPSYDDIDHINDYPKINDTTSQYIYFKAMDFDSAHYHSVIRGGAWMNNGFGVDNSLEDWQCEPCLDVVMKESN